jgi:hypothetical protein
MTNSSAIHVLCPTGSTIQGLSQLGASLPFCSSAKEMIGVFSRLVTQDPRAREFPELIALAHWLRPREIKGLQTRFEEGLPKDVIALGRGVALHFAPGNVDTIFLYSSLLSILAGNVTIVRVSSRSSPQMNLLLDIFNNVLALPEFVDISARIRIIRYERDSAITASLSLACDLRVIWGGDESVQNIRSLPLNPHSRDITFPDRWSLTVLDASSVLNAGDGLASIAKNFANDAFWFGQMGCSSPRLIIWRGSTKEVEKAADLFWPALKTQSEKFINETNSVQFVDKFVAQCAAAIEGFIKSSRNMGTNMVSVSRLTTHYRLPKKLMHIGGGLFWEAQIQELDELAPILDRRSQTIGSFGISSEEWKKWTLKSVACIDRIVPLGQALQFDSIWDGMDLLREFTRLVAIRC